MNPNESSNKKIEKLSKRINKKHRQIEKMRTKRKHHQIEDHKFLTKKRRLEDQIQSIRLKIDVMN